MKERRRAAAERRESAPRPEPLAAGERVRIWPTLHFESGNASQLSADPRVAAGSKSQRSYEGAMLGMPTLPGQAGKQR